MTNFQLYQLINFVSGKDIYSGYLSPAQFELELQAKNLRHFRNRLGLPERYQPGTMQMGASGSRQIETDLLPFLVVEEVDLVDQKTSLTGWYYINDFYTNESRQTEIISQQEYSRLNHPVRIPNAKYPVAMLIKEGLKVWPDTVDKINISYYRPPVTPTFNTKVNETTGEIEYDTSVELEWDDINKLDIVHMILQDLSVNIEKQDLGALAQKLVESGK